MLVYHWICRNGQQGLLRSLGEAKGTVEKIVGDRLEWWIETDMYGTKSHFYGVLGSWKAEGSVDELFLEEK